MLKTRLPAVLVPLNWLAKYRCTSTGVPAGTLNDHCISLPPAPSQRSSRKTEEGVVVGMLGPMFGADGQVLMELPVLRYGLVSVLSAAQSGPPSVAATVGPPALT